MKIFMVVKYYLVSLSFKFHEDPLRRYLQNNIDFPNTLIFNVFSIFLQFHTSKVFQGGKLLNGHGIFWKLDIKMSQYNDEKDICPSS